MSMYNMSCKHIRPNITFVCAESALQTKKFHTVQNFGLGKILNVFESIIFLKCVIF